MLSGEVTMGGGAGTDKTAMVAARRGARTLATLIALTLITSSTAAAQDALSKAKALYNDAAYEDALKVLDQGTGQDASPEVQQYRAFCFIALGRVDDAERAIGVVVATDPFFTPDAREFAPRLVAKFNETRRTLLPNIVKQAFSEARALFLNGDRARAGQRFEDVRRLLSDIPPTEDPVLAGLKSVTDDFIDLLSVETTLRPPASPGATAKPADPAVSTIPAAVSPSTVVNARPNVAVTPPVPVRQVLPQWRPPNDVAAQRSYAGAVKVMIDTNGKVTSAVMERRIHPLYDHEVLQAARGWLYKPATRNGKPIASETIVEIKLGAAPEK